MGDQQHTRASRASGVEATYRDLHRGPGIR